MSRFSRPPEHDEEGSIIIAILVIVILSVSLAAVLQTVEGGLKLSRTDQDRTSAFQQASGGVDQAVYRLDQSAGVTNATSLPATSSGTYVPTVSGGKVTGWTEHVVAAGIDYEITATATPAGQNAIWRVVSVGTDKSGRVREAVATVAAQLLFRDGFFTVDGFYLTGNQHTPDAYDSTRPAAANMYTSKNDPYKSGALLAPPGTRIDASIGSNGTFTGPGVGFFAPRWNGFNMYGRASQAAAEAACQGCSAAGTVAAPVIVRPFADQLKIIDTDAAVRPPAVVSCPSGGVFTGTVAPGDYVCNTVTFKGIVDVAGTGTIRVWPTCRLYMDNSQVNINQSPLRVQIYFQKPAASCGTPNDSGMCDAVVFAMLYTPGMTIDCNGSHQAFMYGAVMAQFYGGTGNQFEFYWDAASQYALHTGKYRVFNWRECPAGTANC